MALTSTPRRAGPYAGTGTLTPYPFAFKVFSPTDVQVTVTDPQGLELDATFGTDYTVALHADQDAQPGGSVAMVRPVLAGYSVTLTSRVPYDQPMVLTNLGGFYPEVLNDNADRQGIQIQQLLEWLSRTLSMPVGSELTYEQLLDMLTEAQAWADQALAIAGTVPPAYDTAAALRAAGTPAGISYATTGGALAAGDGGGGTWRWDAASTADDNIGTVLLPAGHVGAGRWVRDYPGSINVRWFGFLPGRSEPENDAAWEAATDALAWEWYGNDATPFDRTTNGGGTLYVPAGRYDAGALCVYDMMTIRGEGNATEIVLSGGMRWQKKANFYRQDFTPVFGVHLEDLQLTGKMGDEELFGPSPEEPSATFRSKAISHSSLARVRFSTCDVGCRFESSWSLRFTECQWNNCTVGVQVDKGYDGGVPTPIMWNAADFQFENCSAVSCGIAYLFRNIVGATFINQHNYRHDEYGLVLLDNARLITYSGGRIEDCLQANALIQGGDLRLHNGVAYSCVKSHTAGASSEPGVGASWETYWAVEPSQRFNADLIAWASGAVYFAHSAYANSFEGVNFHIGPESRTLRDNSIGARAADWTPLRLNGDRSTRVESCFSGVFVPMSIEVTDASQDAWIAVDRSLGINYTGSESSPPYHAWVLESDTAVVLDSDLAVPDHRTHYWRVAGRVTNVTHNAVQYYCLATHTATAATEPGVGASWETYWAVGETADPEPWALGTVYSKHGDIVMRANLGGGRFSIGAFAVDALRIGPKDYAQFIANRKVVTLSPGTSTTVSILCADTDVAIVTPRNAAARALSMNAYCTATDTVVIQHDTAAGTETVNLLIG